MRVLLPGYGCHMWYLGERVYLWSLGPSRRRIPSSIPQSMLQSSILSGSELRAALQGYDASTLVEQSSDYQQYIHENLLEYIFVGAAEVNFNILSFIIIFFFSIFADYYS